MDYRYFLGEDDGLRIIFRIVRCCDIFVLEMLMLFVCFGGNVIFIYCDFNCVNVIVFFCLIFFIVMVIVVIYIVRLVLLMFE